MPDINLISNVINPYLYKNYRPNENYKYNCCFCNYFNILRFFSKLIYCTLSIIFLIIIIFKFEKDTTAKIIFFVLYLIILILSISINFPGCFMNEICLKSRTKYKIIIRHPIILTISRIFSFFIYFSTIIIIISLILFYQDEDDIKTLEKIKKLPDKFKKQNNNRNLLLHNFCYSTIHNIPIYLYLPFINDAYYFKENNNDTSFNYPNYTNLFYDEEYKIEIIGNLIKKKENESEKGVKMIQYNLMKKRKNNITILSIKGTSYKNDIFLDLQLYFPSLLLNILSTFNMLDQQKETKTFKFIEYSLSIPYRIFFQYLNVDKYLNDLSEAYEENKNNFYNNTVIVGHSLGGGLSKIFGRIKRKQAISLSGPGVNAFHSLWEYQGNSSNFELTAIDIIPDLDLVPRVEISGGTIHRILCLKNPLECHNKELSLCEALILCRNSNYEIYCKNISKLNDKDIEKIENSTKFNFKN